MMKQYTMCQCEYCDYESRSANAVDIHEAEHFGLAVAKWHEYKAKKQHAVYTSHIILQTKNAETEKAFDEAIDDLLSFEKEHNIKV